MKTRSGGGIPAANRVQFNTRIPETMRKRVQFSAFATADAGINIDQITMDALALYFGIETPDVHSRRNRVLDCIKNLQKGKLPFEAPLTSVSHNAAPSRGDAPKIGAPQWHCGGREFESRRLHHPKRNLKQGKRYGGGMSGRRPMPGGVAHNSIQTRTE